MRSRPEQRVAIHALVAGTVLLALKFALFALTNAVAVLGDALESTINVAAAAFMLYSLRLSARPPDQRHRYGHGKVEFFAVGLEGALILAAGLVIGYEAISRLGDPPAPRSLSAALPALAVVGALDAALAVYVIRAGRRLHNEVLVADGKHLMTDVLSTGGVLLGLALVALTGAAWLDPLAALIMAAAILGASSRLLGRSIEGLMDRADPDDERRIREALDEALTSGRIAGYHKLRHRRTGAFHWAEIHIQIDGDLPVREGHAVASEVERRIEQALGGNANANATAHVEPAEDAPTLDPGAPAQDPDAAR